MESVRCFKLSASSIAAFKSCPQRFRLSYREGIRRAEDTDALRIGSNWHAIHEVYRNASEAAYASGYEIAQGDEIQAVIDHLNGAYERKPASKTIEEWDLERRILLTCFIAYLWYYQNDTIEYLAQEQKFDLPLHFPTTGLPLSTKKVVRVGKIDHLIKWQSMVGAVERKSTSRDISTSGDYWERSRKDTQVSMYALAIHDLCRSGQLPVLENLDLQGTTLGNTLYDVWRRPGTKPKMLSQKDTVLFIETGEYFDEKFEVTTHYVLEPCPTAPTAEKIHQVLVDGVEVSEIKPGAKDGTFAIRETVEMYCARLMNDIHEDPARFFQRREIARSEAELRKFRKEIYNIYQSQKIMDENGTWFENESQCRATFPCEYIPICYGEGADAVCDGQTTPSGFRRIFVDVSVEGQAPTEGAH